MSSQQGAPPRSWFRLATMVRPPPAAPTPQPDQAPAPAPAPTPAPAAPRPAFIRPAFSQTFRAPPAAPPPPPPASPPKPPVSQEPRPMPLRQSPPAATTTASPPKLPVPQEPRPMPLHQSPPTRSTPSLTTVTPKASPPKTVKPLEKTPPPSPTIKPISRPPSPLTLPSPQLNSYNRNNPEYEQKTVLVQETKEKPKALDNGDHPRHMGWTAHNPKADATKKPQTSKKHSDSEDSGMRIITIAGENKGAIMDFTPLGNKTHKFGNTPHTLQNPNASSDGGNKSGTDSDGRSKTKNKNQKSASQLMTAFMNSNVQGVNNSILYNSSTTHHDPGVHLSLSRKPNGSRGFHINDHKDHIN